MGFTWYTEAQRIRINLSRKAYLVMEEDMAAFDQRERSTFVNRIFKNFRQKAKASVVSYLQEQENLFRSRLETVDCDQHAKEQILHAYVEQERRNFRDLTDRQLHNKAVSKIYRINNENLEYLKSDECEEEQFYDDRLGVYLKCILEEYALLPYIDREKIFFKEFYDKAETAIRTQTMLKVHTASGKWFHVYPYRIIEDPLSTRCYLTGYSKPLSATGKDKRISSFRIPRLKSLQLLEQSGRLTGAETSELERIIPIRSVQFLVGEEEEICIRLTDAGIKKYRNQLYLRPARDPALSTSHEYVFHCTLAQAQYYFFKFGADALVLKPQALRDRFAAMYQDAARLYGQEPEGATAGNQVPDTV